MTSTTTKTSATNDDGISLSAWMGRMRPLDRQARLAEAVGVVVMTPGGKIDATLILSDSWRKVLPAEYSFGYRLLEMYGDDARVIYPDIENGAVKHPIATPAEDIPDAEIPY